MNGGSCLVRVDSDTHEGEWLRMVACPIRHCDAVRGEDYRKFASHLAAEHGPEDVGLSAGGRRVATDGGTSSSDTERDEEWQRLIEEFGTDGDVFEFTREAVKAYIDFEIEGWRRSDYEHSEGCVHALQNIRSSFFDEMYPCEVCGKTEPHYHEVDTDTDRDGGEA